MCVDSSNPAQARNTLTCVWHPDEVEDFQLPSNSGNLCCYAYFNSGSMFVFFEFDILILTKKLYLNLQITLNKVLDKNVTISFILYHMVF